MLLTRTTDHALRILMMMPGQQEEACTVGALADRLQLPLSSTMKIVADLVRLGYAESLRGREGGVRRGALSATGTVGNLVRALEPDLAPVACLASPEQACLLRAGCRLRAVMEKAKDAFLASLDDTPLHMILAARLPSAALQHSPPPA